MSRRGFQAVSDIPGDAAARVTCVLADIDDTITTGGRLGAAAYSSLEDLQSAGFSVVPVTGRPAGWCDLIARFWPVDGVIGENGAFYFRYDRAERRMRSRFWASGDERASNRARLDALASTILSAVPGAALASDQPYRVADLAIDFCEDVTPLDAGRVDEILRLFGEAGATAKASSIHVNGWFGAYDKLTMAREFLRMELGLAPDEITDAVVFVGDSPNDEPMFEAFPLSVRVANVLHSAGRMRHMPAYVTSGEGGAGFVELARHLIAAKTAARPASPSSIGMVPAR